MLQFPDDSKGGFTISLYLLVISSVAVYQEPHSAMLLERSNA